MTPYRLLLCYKHKLTEPNFLHDEGNFQQLCLEFHLLDRDFLNQSMMANNTDLDLINKDMQIADKATGNSRG